MAKRIHHSKKAMHHPDKPGAGAKKRRHLGPKKRVATVMAEYERGTLRGGHGKHVHNPKQAVAIALSEGRKSGLKYPPKKKKD